MDSNSSEEGTSGRNDGEKLQLGNAWALTLIACVLVIGAVIVSMLLQKRREHGFSTSFVGPDKCAECHKEQHASWADTRMAHSFDVLRPGQNAKEKETAGLDPQKDYTHDEKCLPCHTTGYKLVGGFVSIEQTPKMAGVTCEACHGAGALYVQTEMQRDRPTFEVDEARGKGLQYPPTAEVCRGCHNRQSPFVGANYRFDYDERVGRGTHKHVKLIYENAKKVQ